MRGLIALAVLVAASAMLAGCSAKTPSVQTPCEIREIARACNVDGNERFIGVSRSAAPTSCMSGASFDSLTLSVPYQDLRAIDEARAGKVEMATGYEKYLISLLPSKPVRDDEMPGVLYACADLCRAVMPWQGYAVVVSWSDRDVAPRSIVRSATASLETWTAQCRRTSQ